MQKIRYVVALGISLLALLSFTLVAAWTDPTEAPPNGNVAAPINVGSIAQVKNGGLGVNTLTVFGNSLFGGSAGSNAYLNFGDTSGDSGYGIRDNAGTLEFKNDGGDWYSLQTIVYDLAGGGSVSGSGTTNYIPSYSNSSTLGNSLLYNSDTGDNNTNGVGVGTASPHAGLQVETGSGTFALHDPAISNFMWVFDHYSTDGTGNLLIRKTDLSGSSPVVVMTLTPAGKVGIGAYPPQEKLDVAGGNINTNNYLKVTAWPGYGSGAARFWYDGAAAALKLDQALTVNGVVTATGWYTSSDRRLKTEIEPIKDGLTKLDAIEGVSFIWKPGTPKAGQRDVGVIAQDVERVLPEAVHTDENGMKSVDYPHLVPLLINAVKEQQDEIKDLKTQLEQMKATVAALVAQVAATNQ